MFWVLIYSKHWLKLKLCFKKIEKTMKFAYIIRLHMYPADFLVIENFPTDQNGSHQLNQWGRIGHTHTHTHRYFAKQTLITSLYELKSVPQLICAHCLYCWCVFFSLAYSYCYAFLWANLFFLLYVYMTTYSWRWMWCGALSDLFNVLKYMQMNAPWALRAMIWK